MLEETQRRFSQLKTVHEWFASLLAFPTSIHHQEVMFMLKNKFGFTKDQAKKLYSTFRSKGESGDNGDDGDEENNSVEPQTIDDKISMIMGYMKETSAKLDRIEDDITYLKQQVENILKRI
ncbi:MAG: hypothetical protein C4527_15535 [Candidatus Omnitrophota bacterium]|nr:MAG: hypothetical protein C4527_15535 [Candidatus Omnitrophota bacterium]